MAKLEIITGKEKGRRVDLAGKKTVVFGRDLGCEVQLTDLLSSRRHFRVVFEDGAYYVEDMGSSNGTLLNEKEVKKSPLTGGDEIRIGETIIQFRDNKSSSRTPSAGAASAPGGNHPFIGKTIGGYRIDDFIGRGGMGTVFQANQISLNRTVALKILENRLTSDSKFIDMFVREARAAGGLNHPNIVQVYDVGEAEGIHFFSMELMNKGSVGEMLKDMGKLPVPKALEMIIHAAKGLEYAEKKNIVHCDIKPDNLMISDEGLVKIVDLGLSKNVLREGEEDESEVVFGTPHFIAPEQAQKLKVDHRADIYSLGASFYLMLTGRTPYTGDSGREIALKHIKEALVPVREVNPEIPDRIDAIVRRMMAKEAKDRYQSATKLLEDLRKANIEINPSAAYTDGFPGIPATESRTGAARLVVPLIVAAVVLGVIILALAGVFSGGDPATPAPVPGTGGPQTKGDGGEGDLSQKAKDEAERQRLQRDKEQLEKKLREEKARAAYNQAVTWEERHGGNLPETLARYRKVAREYPQTEAGKKAKTRADEIEGRLAARQRREEDAQRKLDELEGQASRLIKELRFQKALASFDAFPADAFKGTAAAGKIKGRKNYVKGKAASTYDQIVSEAKVHSSQGRHAEAKALFQKVIDRYGIAAYVQKAHKELGKIDREIARLAREKAQRILSEDEALFDGAVARAKEASGNYDFRTAQSEMRAVLDGTGPQGRKLRTPPFIEKAQNLEKDLKNLGRLHRQVIAGVGRKKGKIQISVSRTGKRPRILEADEKGLKIKLGPGITSMTWTDLTFLEYHELAVLALPRDPESQLLLGVHAMVHGGALGPRVRGHLEEALTSTHKAIKQEAQWYWKRFSEGTSTAGKQEEEKARALFREFRELYRSACNESDPDEAIRIFHKAKEKLGELRQKYGHTKFVRDLDRK
jgi:hypothetical protein